MEELQREKMLEVQPNQEQALPVAQDIRSKPAEPKTIYQRYINAADVTAKLPGRARKLLDDLLDTMDKTARLRKAMADNSTQLIEDIVICQQAVVAWQHDVTATVTEIVVKFGDIQQEYIALRTRQACVCFFV